jgi:hypothetical protein
MEKIIFSYVYIRDVLHNLDYAIPANQILYDQILYHHLIESEGYYNFAYDDKRTEGQNSIAQIGKVKGKVTVGIGFNMDAESAEEDWEYSFGDLKDFGKVRTGAKNITNIQIDKLYETVLLRKRREFEKLYKNIIQKLRLNERLVIEDLHYQLPSLVSAKSSFYKYIHSYCNTGDKAYLDLAINEVKNRSNKPDENGNRSEGIQKRRNKQAEILNSTKAPFYSSPHSPLLPIKSIKAKLGDTVIPRGTENWDKPKHSEYFIWRTQCDQKVRESHLLLEGQIFTNDFKPALGGPGEDYNCRCTKEILPTNIEVIRNEKEPISKKYFDINLELFGIELHNLREEIHEFLVKKRSEKKAQLT